jgi:hypothetical protein
MHLASATLQTVARRAGESSALCVGFVYGTGSIRRLASATAAGRDLPEAQLGVSGSVNQTNNL